MNRSPRLAAAILAAAWLPLLASAGASAAKLVEVRVGDHDDYTRIVLETDSPVRYELGRDVPGEVRVRLFANASPRKLGSKSALLKEVVVESDASGSVARLALKKSANVDVKQMVLDKPPRIVIDLVPHAGGAGVASNAGAVKTAVAAKKEEAKAAAPSPAPAPLAEAKEAKEPAPEPVKAPEPAKAPEAAKAPEPVKSFLTAKGQEPAPGADAEPPPRTASETAREAAAQAELDRLAGVPSRPPSAHAQEPDDEDVAAAEEPGAGAAAGSEPEAQAPAEEAAPPAQAEAREARRRNALDAMDARIPQRVKAQPGSLGFMPSPFDDPLVLGVVLMLFALIGALVVLRRRGARAAEQQSHASPFASNVPIAFGSDEAGGIASEAAELPAPYTGGATAPPDPEMGPLFASAAERSMPSGSSSLFEPGEAESEQAKEYDAALLATRAAELGPASSSSSSSSASFESGALEGDVMRIVEELERRIAHLETRLEEVVDAKERLERGMAAQTEELRVQRAAIARTQRVLRTVVKADDLATEPVPK